MGIKSTVAALGVATTVAFGIVAVPAANGEAESTGLWTTDFAAHQDASDCGEWRLDENDFCVANDARNGLEVGVKFTTSRELLVTGVRIYRVDPFTVRGSLWTADGSLLARGTFAKTSRNGWQDLTFSAPVTIAPGRTYVASYFTPGTKYAFRYGYFAKSGRTVGPVTALRSVEGDPNGVHCYDDTPCTSVPVRGYRSSSYWVSPLWQVPGDGPTDPPTQTPTDPPGDPDDPTVDQQAPQVAATTPGQGAKRLKLGVTVRARFSEPVRAKGLTRSTVRLLRQGSSKPVAAKVRYDAKKRRVVLRPASALRPATKYRVVVTSDVRDLAGNRLDQKPTRPGLQKASWSFRTK